jgi:GntR family transcriptional regulator
MTVAHPGYRTRQRAPRRDVATAAAALRDLLRTKVLLGYYDKRPLPDEAALQLAHRASRGAVRAALALLRDEGLIERNQGLGTFVVAQKATNRFDELTGLRGGDRVSHELLSREVLGAADIVAELLCVEPGTDVIRLERRTTASGERVGVWTNYLPLSLGAPLMRPDADLRGEYYHVLERLCGLPLAYANLSAEAVAADSLVAATLDIPVGTALMRLERVVHLADGRPVDFGVGRLRGDRLRMSGTQLRRHPPAGTGATSR